MANTIHLISKEYLNPNKISDTIEKLGVRLAYGVGRSYNKEYDIIEINLFKENLDKYLRVSISCQSDFNDTFNNLYNIKKYGIMISISYEEGDLLLIPLLKETLEEIPELLVYNEETPKGIGSYIFNKSHLLNFSGIDSYTFLSSPPKI